METIKTNLFVIEEQGDICVTFAKNKDVFDDETKEQIIEEIPLDVSSYFLNSVKDDFYFGYPKRKPINKTSEKSCAYYANKFVDDFFSFDQVQKSADIEKLKEIVQLLENSDETKKDWIKERIEKYLFMSILENDFVYGKDGNQITATLKNFINLQESPCGFGDTKEDAANDLIKKLLKDKQTVI